MKELLASAIVSFHDGMLNNPDWPETPDRYPTPPFRDIEANHRYNCRLWAEEDLARRVEVDDREIAANKRHIDRFNQARNDAVERIDEAILAAHPSAQGRLHSETAGMMIDRLSILSLKLYHTRRQLGRSDVDDTHVQRCHARLSVLSEQRKDLATCLDQLLADMAAGLAHYKVYRQFKMYNDPRFNPYLTKEAKPA